MILLDPQQQRPGIMQCRSNSRVLLHQRKKGVVGILITLFENVFEITGWLVGVNDQHYVKWGEGLAHGAHIS
jgi:hypothetical protein